MLTHALASEEEAVPYMQGHASQALVVAGRSAALMPAIASREAVFYGWKDALLPLMLSGLVPDDTLFLVCEEDFRFSPEDARNPRQDHTVEETQGDALVKSVQQSEDARALARVAAECKLGCFSAGWNSWLCEAHCGGKCLGVCGHRTSAAKQQRKAEHSAAQGSTEAEPSAAQRSRAFGRPEEQSILPPRGAEHLPAPDARSGASHFGWSQEVEDLVAYCNHASNGKAGDIVWLSWCPDGRADDNKQFADWMLTPCHGATMLGITVRGAFAMSGAMKESAPRHFDLWLKEAVMSKHGLLTPSKQSCFGASYLWPPTGSYATHKSANAAPPAKGSAKKNKHSGLTETGDRLEDWGYPNQPCTRISAAMDGQALPGAVRGWQKWHSFQLVHIHGAQTTGTGKRIVSPEYASGKIHLEKDMHRCLWWTFAAAAMNDLDKWLFPEQDERAKGGWPCALMALSPGAERLAAPASEYEGRPGRNKSHQRTVRMQKQWCLRRLDHGFCEACLLNTAHVVMRSRFMQIYLVLMAIVCYAGRRLPEPLRLAWTPIAECLLQ